MALLDVRASGINRKILFPLRSGTAKHLRLTHSGIGVRLKSRTLILVMFAATAVARLAIAQTAGFAAATDNPPAVIPADVQLAPLVSQSYPEGVTQAPVAVPPSAMPIASPQGIIAVPGPYSVPIAAPPGAIAMPAGAYPNVPAQWIEYGPGVQPAPPMMQPVMAAPATDQWCPRWYIDANVMAISRDNYSRHQNIWPNLSTNGLQFNDVAAPYITIGYFVDPHNQWQLVYFNAIDMQADALAGNPSNVETTVNDKSNVENAELNYLHTWTHWSFLAGFRYFHFDDRFFLQYRGPGVSGGSEIFNFDTANDLYGGQLGFHYHREWSWIVLDTGAKWGIYGNSAVQHGVISQGGSITAQVSNYPSSTAVSGEFDLELGHRFSPHWMGQLGLMVVEVDNVALAADANESDQADGNVTLVGLSLGATAQW
jgi:hypothetical protein